MALPDDPQTFLIGVAAAAGGAIVALQFTLTLALRRLERRLGSLDRLQGLETALQKLAEREAAIDLRRTEHTLLDVRDQLKRLEERLLAVSERGVREQSERNGTGTELVRVTTPASIASLVTDRILARLLALGYERIQIVTSTDDLAKLGDTDGAAIVEARRDGALCKGRVRVAHGLVGAIEVQPAYSAFP
jgi:hypothetical protein